MSLVKDQGCYVYVGVMGHGIENLGIQVEGCCKSEISAEKFRVDQVCQESDQDFF